MGKDAFGRDVIGVYPLMNDNTCNFLCTDFDDKSCEHGYQNDVLAFVCVCKEWEIPCYIERSRSGNGAHVWIFFKTPTTATKARKLGKTILSEAMNKDVRLSFNSYDRFFPNQDTLLIKRPEKFGGDIELTHDELIKDFGEGNLHPMDLKNGIKDFLIEFFAPVREYMEEN